MSVGNHKTMVLRFYDEELNNDWTYFTFQFYLLIYYKYDYLARMQQIK